jgi:type II secretory pathway pseudopilin PulG
MIQRSRAAPQETHDAAGFSYVEAMVAMVIMAIVAITSLQLFSQFTTSFSNTRRRDAINALMLQDLGKMRQLVQSYCRYPNPGPLAACTGAVATQDWNGSYNPDDTVNGHCDLNRLAEAMVSSNPTKFPSPDNLDTSSSPNPLQGVVITRTLSAQGNELTIDYVTTSGSNIQVRTNTKLVPPALGWCP